MLNPTRWWPNRANAVARIPIQDNVIGRSLQDGSMARLWQVSVSAMPDVWHPILDSALARVCLTVRGLRLLLLDRLQGRQQRGIFQLGYAVEENASTGRKVIIDGLGREMGESLIVAPAPNVMVHGSDVSWFFVKNVVLWDNE